MPAFEFVVPLTSNAGMGITMPIPGNTQPWQQFVSQDLRYHIVFKLVQAVFPSPDLKAMKVKGMGKVVASAQRMGKDMSKPAVRRSTITSWLTRSTRSRRSCSRSNRRGCRIQEVLMLPLEASSRWQQRSCPSHSLPTNCPDLSIGKM